jgi:hypothetical protein
VPIRQWLTWSKSHFVFECTAIILFVLAIWFRAFWPVPMGLPDNGDFPKVLGRINAWPVKGQEGQQFKYLVTDYVIDPDHHWNSHLPTLELPLARLAKVIARLTLPQGRFDLRILGAIHALILVPAVWLLLRTLRHYSWIWLSTLATVTILVFADVEYLEFLNCAFMDASAIMLLVLLFSLGLTITKTLPAPRWGLVAAFNLCAVLFLSTKLQHQFSVIPLTLFCFYFGWQAASRKARLTWFSGAILVIGTSIWMIRHRLPDYQADSGFSLVFLKLLPLSKSPQQSLRELGRPESDVRYMGMHTWSPGSPMSDNQYRDRFWHDVATSKVMRFYWRHPDILCKILWHDLLKSGSDIPVSEVPIGLERKIVRAYGAFRKSDNPQPNTRPQMLNFWSDFRRFLALKIPILIPALYVICIVVGLYKICWRPTPITLKRWPLLLLMGAIGILSYLAGSLGDATDTSRHIVSYQVATDLMILFLLYQIPRETAPQRHSEDGPSIQESKISTCRT